MSTINFPCYACNQVLKVGADKAGRKAKCIKCGTILTIPMASAEEPVEAVSAAPAKTPQAVKSAPPPPVLDDEDDRPRKRRRDEDEEEDEDRPRKRRRDEDEEDEDRPRKRGRDDDDDRDDADDRPRKRRRDEDDEDDRPKKTRRDDDDDYDRKKSEWKDNWPKVRLGMLLTFIGACVYAGGYALEHIGVLLMTIATMSSNMGFGRGTSDIMEILVKIALPVMQAALITVVVGQVFWIFVTNKFGKLAFAIAALSVSALTVIFFLVFKLIPVFHETSLPYGFLILMPRSMDFRGNFGPSIGNALVPSMVNIFMAVAFMMMAFYLRGIGLALKKQSLAKSSMMIVIMAGVSAGYQLLWPMLSYAFLSPNTGRGIIVLIWIIYWLGVILNGVLLVFVVMNLKRAREYTDR